MSLLNFFRTEPQTLADRAAQGPQLLSGQWSLCAHKKGYWYESESKVSDATGTYLQIKGGCKSCSRQVVGVHELTKELV